jgi:copper oxidase (laccase) domain-containing protein
MPKKSYSQRDTTPDRTLDGRYLLEEGRVEILLSNLQDGNMDPRFSKDALSNYQSFLEKHGISPLETFSPAIGLNFGIISINEANEEKFAGRFIENGTPPDEYHCDAVVVCDSNLSLAFRVGDCPTVLIIGEAPQEKKVLALIHAGRKELLAEILKTTVVRMLSDHKMHLRNATAYVFPHICKHCYALSHLDQKTQEKTRDFLEYSDGLLHLDLLSWLKQQLKEAGIQRVSTAFFRCTAGTSRVCVSRLLHDTKKFPGFFSNYRSYHCGDPEGRFLIVARITDPNREDEDSFEEN